VPLTKLDPIAALVLIDLQKGIVGLPTVHPAGEIVGRAAELARAFRKRGLPVVLVHVTAGAPGRTDAGIPNITRPADWAEFVPALEQKPEDHVVTKHRWGAFIGTDLDSYLRQRGVTQIFVAGISTSAGVESTARSAFDLAYNVVLVTDAMTDRDAEAHRLCVEKIFPRLSETTATNEVLSVLRERA
jgi:nicotinamidase-related amidase